MSVSILYLLFLRYVISARAAQAFVCITGQLNRLEIQTKIQNFIKPNAGKIDVSFVLDLNSKYATNTVVGNRSLPSMNEVVSQFESAGARVLFFNTQAQTAAPDVSSVYVMQLDKRKFSLEKRLERARNHFRQYEAYARCNYEALTRDYDVYLRIRDDTMFSSAFLISPLPDGIHVPRCNAWGGVNDRSILIVGKTYAGVYFSLLDRFKNFDRGFSHDQRRSIVNPETFLATSMVSANIPIHFDCEFNFSFLSSHVDMSTGKSCVTAIDRGLSPYSRPSPLDTCSFNRSSIVRKCSLTDESIPDCPVLDQKMNILG